MHRACIHVIVEISARSGQTIILAVKPKRVSDLFGTPTGLVALNTLPLSRGPLKHTEKVARIVWIGENVDLLEEIRAL